MRATPVNSFLTPASISGVINTTTSDSDDDSPPSDESDSKTIKETDFKAARSSDRVTERTLDTLSDPQHPEYEKYLQQEVLKERDEDQLLQELRGERVVAVHGVGLWSCSATINIEVEQTKQKLWGAHASRGHWLASAKAREMYFRQLGAVRPPLRWTLVENGSIPFAALPTGTDSAGRTLYSARAWLDGGGVLVGKVSQGVCFLSHGSAEHRVDRYEVLAGDSSYVHWQPIPKGTVLSFDDTQGLSGCKPIEGGRDLSGACQFIAQAEFDGGWHPGKATLGTNHCCLAYGGGEVWVHPFRVLTWATEAL